MAIIVSVTVGGVFILGGLIASFVYAKHKKQSEENDLDMDAKE